MRVGDNNDKSLASVGGGYDGYAKFLLRNLEYPKKFTIFAQEFIICLTKSV